MFVKMKEKNNFLLATVFYFLYLVLRTEGLICFTCIDATSNEECNREGYIVECSHNELSCQNEVRLSEGDRYRITKRCKQKLACENNQAQNDRPAWDPTQCNPEFSQNSVCKCCCDTDLCNEVEMPCDKKPRCSALTKLSNGSIECSNLNFVGSVCSFRCDQNYRIEGANEMGCEEHQRGNFWSSDMPVCERSTCGNVMPPAPLNGRFRCTDSNRVSSVCRFACEEGYELRGSTRVECEPHGFWSNRFPICQQITCDMEEIRIENGEFVCDNANLFGSSCFFECGPGYLIEGEAITTCGNYEWSNLTPNCIRGTCAPARPAPRNGTVRCSDERNSFSTCTFSCGRPPRENAWELYGIVSTTCEMNPSSNTYEWSTLEVPCCAKRCPPHAMADLFLVLDSSSSVGRENWNKTLFFIKDVIDQFEISEDDVLVAAVRYNRFIDTRSEIRIGQYTTKESTINAIIGLPYDGSGTHTGNALEYVLESMVTAEENRRGVRDFVFVVTDGISNDDVVQPARRLREYGVTVLALGVVNEGGTLEKEDINEIAGSPDTAFLIESGFEGLSINVTDLIEKQLCGVNPCL